jgi:hypothetical protein
LTSSICSRNETSVSDETSEVTWAWAALTAALESAGQRLAGHGAALSE